MKTLPPKTVEGLKFDGIDIRDKQLIMVSTEHFRFKQGMVLVLDSDDGTFAPYFRPVEGGEGQYVNMDRLAIYDPSNPKHLAWRTKLRLTK